MAVVGRLRPAPAVPVEVAVFAMGRLLLAEWKP